MSTDRDHLAALLEDLAAEDRVIGLFRDERYAIADTILTAGYHRITPAEKRAIAAQVLTERADELDANVDRLGAQDPRAGSAMRFLVDHLRSYVTYRLPYDFEEQP